MSSSPTSPNPTSRALVSQITRQDLVCHRLRQRQLSRRITRSAMGSFISWTLALFMPWQLLSGALNTTLLVRSVRQFKELQRHLAAAGLGVRKRLIVQGLVEGALLKTATTILLLGHDDVFLVLTAVDSWFDSAGEWIANHASPSSGLALAEQAHVELRDAIEADELGRASHELVERASAVAQWPTGQVQDAMGLPRGEVFQEQGTTAWHGGGAVVARQVFVAGAAQAATEFVLDKVLENPVDKTVDGAMMRLDGGRDRTQEEKDNAARKQGKFV